MRPADDPGQQHRHSCSASPAEYPGPTPDGSQTFQSFTQIYFTVYSKYIVDISILFKGNPLRN